MLPHEAEHATHSIARGHGQPRNPARRRVAQTKALDPFSALPPGTPLLPPWPALPTRRSGQYVIARHGCTTYCRPFSCLLENLVVAENTRCGVAMERPLAWGGSLHVKAYFTAYTHERTAALKKPLKFSGIR